MGDPSPAAEAITIDLTINGQAMTVPVRPTDRLLDLLREQLGLTGTKEGCGEGECGSCTVELDGLPVNSCLVPAYQARGRVVTTIEALEPGDVESMLRSGGTQCGACTPGVMITACWIRRHPDLLDRSTARQLMAGNLCRCTGYDGIINGLLDGLRPGERD